MSQLLERQREQVDYRVPVSRRSAVGETVLIAIGVLAAGVGVYFQFAPDSWWLAHFAEAYHFAAYTLGGVLLAAGLGVYADRAFDEDTFRSGRVTTGVTLAVLAAIGAAVAVVFWII